MKLFSLKEQKKFFLSTKISKLNNSFSINWYHILRVWESKTRLQVKT